MKKVLLWRDLCASQIYLPVHYFLFKLSIIFVIYEDFAVATLVFVNTCNMCYIVYLFFVLFCIFYFLLNTVTNKCIFLYSCVLCLTFSLNPKILKKKHFLMLPRQKNIKR